MIRIVAVCSVALIAISSVSAAAPHVQTVAIGHGVDHVTLTASTSQLQSRLWVQRLRGVGIVNASADVTCEQRTSHASSGGSEMFTFTLSPSARQMIWRYGGTRPCMVTVSIRGKGRLALALRGY
jgi:hypothetical protein